MCASLISSLCQPGIETWLPLRLTTVGLEARHVRGLPRERPGRIRVPDHGLFVACFLGNQLACVAASGRLCLLSSEDRPVLSGIEHSEELVLRNPHTGLSWLLFLTSVPYYFAASPWCLCSFASQLPHSKRLRLDCCLALEINVLMLETSSFSHLFFIFLFGFPLLPPPVVTPPRPSSGIGLCQAVLVLHRLQPSLPAAPTQQTAPHRREYFVDWRVAFTPCFMAVPCYHVQDRHQE